jgi:hypothetical protein
MTQCTHPTEKLEAKKEAITGIRSTIKLVRCNACNALIAVVPDDLEDKIKAIQARTDRIH